MLKAHGFPHKEQLLSGIAGAAGNNVKNFKKVLK